MHWDFVIDFALGFVIGVVLSRIFLAKDEKYSTPHSLNCDCECHDG